MGRRVPRGLAHHIRDLAQLVREDARTDGDLLAAFVDARDEAAFTALVVRHSQTVWAACRHILANDSDAEDAFQATFIALARYAGALRREPLAGWLARVAQTVAWKVERAAQRRENAHRRLCEQVSPPAGEAPPDDDLLPLVREELALLPERLRTTLTLYYLEGKTQAEVGDILGVTDRAVAARLGKGLNVLRQALARRGAVVTAAALVAALGNHWPVSAVPARLPDLASEAALAAASNAPLSAAADQLAVGVWQPAGRMRGIVFAVVVCVAGGGIGGLIALEPHPTGRPDARESAAIVKPPEASARVDRFGDPLPEGATARIGTLRFWSGDGIFDATHSAAGNTLVTVGGRNGDLSFWTADGWIRERIAGPNKGRRVSLSADGRRLAAAGESEVWAWDLTPAGPRLRWTWAAKKRPGLRTQKEITALAFSPDGKVVVCGDAWAGNTSILDADSGQSLRTLEGVAWPPLCFTADGRTLAAPMPAPSPFIRKQVAIWDVASGERKILAYPGGEKIVDFDLASDGKRLAWIGQDGLVRVCDPATGREVANWQADFPNSLLVFQPDGRTLLEFGLGRIRFRNADTGEVAGRPVEAPNVWFNFTTGGQGGKQVAGGGGLLTFATHGSVATFETATGREVGPSGRHLYSPPRSLSFSPNGRQLLSLAGPGGLQIWNAETGRLEGRLSPDEAALVHDGSFTSGGDVSLTHFRLPTEKADRQKFESNFSRWDGRASSPLRSGTVDLSSAGAPAVSFDGRWMARVAGDNGAEISLADLATGKEVRRLKSSLGVGPHTVLVFSADGRTLLAYSPMRAVEVWDAETGRMRSPATLETPGSVTVPTLSADGRLMATATREPVGENSDRTGTHSPVQFTYRVAIWDVEAGKLSRWLPAGSGHPGCVAFAPDGRLMAVGQADGAVVLWNLITGREVRRFVGHRATVRALAFAPDGRRLASGSDDCTGLVWDVSGLVEQPGK